jgi:hypothetical protein
VKAGHVEPLDGRSGRMEQLDGQPSHVEQLDGRLAWSSCESEVASSVGQLEVRGGVCES